MFKGVSTQELEITDALIARLIKELYSSKPGANEIEAYQKLYRKAVEAVIEGQYGEFEEVISGNVDDMMNKAHQLFGPEAARKLKPQTVSLLTQAFKAGKAMEGVPDKVKQVFDQAHRAAVDWLIEHDGFWIGKVFPQYVAGPFKETIASGLEAGLGRKTIARQLKNLCLGYGEMPGKTVLYNRVASASVNRAHNWGGMFAMEEAGLKSAIWRAVGDERTCSRCAYLNGRSFSVPKLMKKVQLAVKSKPEAIESIAPWPGYDAAEDDYYIPGRYGRQYFKNKPEGWLEENGIGLPPLHPHCRCQIIAKEG